MDAITVDEIEARWKAGPRSRAGNVEMWNAQADKAGYLTVPSIETDAFLRLLDGAGALRDGIDVLDVGCGAGAYSAALSERANRAVGIDLSPRMIESGKRLIADRGVENVQLSCGDWNGIDTVESSYEGAFDLVFAHNTPAFSSYSALNKLINCSRGFCAVCAPTTMHEPMLEALRAELGVGETFDRMRNMVFTLDFLLLSGARPQVAYDDAVWTVSQTIESAIPYYVGKLWAPGGDRELLAKRVGEFLSAKARGGCVEDAIRVVMTMIVWKVAN